MSDTTVPKGWRRHMRAHTAPGQSIEQMCCGIVWKASSQNIQTNVGFVFGHYDAYDFLSCAFSMS